MAFGVAAQHHFQYLFSIHANSSSSSYSNLHSPIHCRCSTKCANGYRSIRFRTVAKALVNKKQPVEGDRVGDDDSDRNSLSSAMYRIRAGIRLDALGMEILSIVLPAADPITSLDTGFVGHIG